MTSPAQAQLAAILNAGGGFPGLGIIAGDDDNFIIERRNGHNETVGTTAEIIAQQGGVLSVPGAAAVISVASSDNVADTGAGTGALTVRITGLDGNYKMISEDAVMGGQTEATTTATFLRVFDVEVLTAGSGGANAGTIYVGVGTFTAGVPATIYLQIPPAQNISQNGAWTVPAGFTAYLMSSEFWTDNINTTFELMDQTDTGLAIVRTHIPSTRSGVGIPASLPRSYAEKTDIEPRVFITGASSDCACELVFLCIPD